MDNGNFRVFPFTNFSSARVIAMSPKTVGITFPAPLNFGSFNWWSKSCWVPPYQDKTGVSCVKIDMLSVNSSTSTRHNKPKVPAPFGGSH
ncbi:hypothetical protein Lal_00020247 [Lupinus albus]|nr:hypothetical protein Lal_00020247 [Lupinus albus]